MENIEKQCLECGKLLKIRSKREIKRKKFCSRKCLGTYYGRERFKNHEFLAKFRAAANTPEANAKKVHKGEEHPRWNGGLLTKQCNWCGKNFETTRDKNKNGNGKYCSRACFEKWQSSGVKKTGMRDPHEIICKLCGKRFFVQKCKKDTAKYCCVRCHNIGNLIFAKKFKNTSIEIKLKKIATEVGLIFKEHKQIGKLTVPDIFIEPNFAIYADGDYWHSIPVTVERDKKINENLKQMGYEVIRFSEYIINNNPDIVKSKLEEVYVKCQP